MLATIYMHSNPICHGCEHKFFTMPVQTFRYGLLKTMNEFHRKWVCIQGTSKYFYCLFHSLDFERCNLHHQKSNLYCFNILTEKKRSFFLEKNKDKCLVFKTKKSMTLFTAILEVRFLFLKLRPTHNDYYVHCNNSLLALLTGFCMLFRKQIFHL